MAIVRVLIPAAGLFPLDYETDLVLELGQLVLVPLRNKEVMAIIWDLNPDIDADNKCGRAIKFKHIIRTLGGSSNDGENIILASSILQLIKRASQYYVVELGSIAKLVLPVAINEDRADALQQDLPSAHQLSVLSAQQEACLEQIRKSGKVFLLHGVTGSGKTEIYFHALWDELQKGHQVLIMLPEIALSTQIIDRFKKRFGFAPAIWNSKVTPAKKRKILAGIMSGSVKLVIGARSALFLPYKNLGMMIVDEEHDSSYKQSEGVPYSARDMAVLRSHIEEHAKLLLVSATPSIESIYNSMIGRYHLLRVESRFKGALLPSIKVIDMRQVDLPRNRWLSEEAIKQIVLTVSLKQQALVFLNRRGYAPLLLCKLCGYRANCRNCSSSMVVHHASKHLECHHCSSKMNMPSKCPDCDGDGLVMCGPGVERIAEEISALVPHAKLEVISRDITNSDEMRRLLHEIEHGAVDIVVGTQIITKGYHFPNMTLVVVVDPDAGLNGADLRSAERTFQLLQQVGGRAGRESQPGQVLLQTYFPENKVIVSLSALDAHNFTEAELEARKNSNMPPFSRVALITISGKDEHKTELFAKNFAAMAPILKGRGADDGALRILGPAPSVIKKLSKKYRYQILLIASKNFPLQKYLSQWKLLTKFPSILHLKIDIDPQNLL